MSRFCLENWIRAGMTPEAIEFLAAQRGKMTVHECWFECERRFGLISTPTLGDLRRFWRSLPRRHVARPS